MEDRVPDTSHDQAARYAAPAWTLLAVNIIPLIGVVLWNWSAFHVVALYWFENVILGVVNVLKLATCAPDRDALQRKFEKLAGKQNAASARTNPLEALITGAGTHALITGPASHALKLFLVPFFIFHYGMFCVVHGVFIHALLGGGLSQMERGLFDGLADMLVIIFGGSTLIAVLALAASHLFSFVYHYLVRGEYRQTHPIQLMIAPYARVFVLHIAILAGAFAIMMLGQPLILLILLVVGKTLLDWRLHIKAHAGSGY